jgi:hypothetical protein
MDFVLDTIRKIPKMAIVKSITTIHSDQGTHYQGIPKSSKKNSAIYVKKR